MFELDELRVDEIDEHLVYEILLQNDDVDDEIIENFDEQAEDDVNDELAVHVLIIIVLDDDDDELDEIDAMLMLILLTDEDDEIEYIDIDEVELDEVCIEVQ